MSKENKHDSIYIKGLSLNEIESLLVSLGYKKFRGLQLYKWMYSSQKTDPSDMTNLPGDIKDFLNKQILSTLNCYKIQTSKNKLTKKFAFQTLDSKIIESVSMIDRDRHTVCISSQIGCNVDCKFCATATMGFIRNLKVGEIIDQIIMISNNVKIPITNIVFMGMGEPFLNYKNVLQAADILHNPHGFNFGYNRITISTSGILPKIKQFIDSGFKYRLAISLNSVDNKQRTKIMPINKKWPIETIIKQGNRYTQNNKSCVMYEYVLFKDVNDSDDDAVKLSKLLANSDSKLNIIPYNETDLEYSRPSNDRIERFTRIVFNNRRNFRVLIRWSKGDDIDAACGQLAGK
tara:strand:- start:251 stop:1291 length:1041 start_codon:yes stop_codon:yes gene_type:complete